MAGPLSIAIIGAGRGGLASTAPIQQTSRANRWLCGKTDTDWVYGCGAWTVPLAA